jgi:phospholipase/carboxylesterase
MPAAAPDALTLLLLHGTGGDESDLLKLGRALDPDAALLSPRGHVSEHGANRWFRRLAEGVFDIDDLLARTDELAAFVGDAVDHYDLDPDRLVAVGFSNGANIAATVLQRHPQLLRAAALFAAMPALPDPPAVDLSGVAVFLAAGRADPIVAPEQTERLADQLLSRGAAVQLHWNPGGHAIDQPILAAARAWLQKVRAVVGDAALP